jgi:integrase
LNPAAVQAILCGFTDLQARVVFLTVVLTGIRCAEMQKLKWTDVDLIENRLGVVDSKTKTGGTVDRAPAMLAEELWQWRRITTSRGDEEHVFCNQDSGGVIPLQLVQGRPPGRLHGLRDGTSAGVPESPRSAGDEHHERRPRERARREAAARSGHANFSTTQRYIDLVGVVFHEEAEALEQRMLGLSTNPSTRLSEPRPLSDDAASLNDAAAA